MTKLYKYVICNILNMRAKIFDLFREMVSHSHVKLPTYAMH